MDKFASTLSLSCLFILWFGIMLLLIRSFVMGLKSKSWPNVNGKITQSQISKARRSQTGSLIDHYRVVIEYEFVIDDISFKSQALSFPDQTWKILKIKV